MAFLILCSCVGKILLEESWDGEELSCICLIPSGIAHALGAGVSLGESLPPSAVGVGQPCVPTKSSPPPVE